MTRLDSHQPLRAAGRFADYVFVSPGVDVRAFRVPLDEVSDHAPLMLEFSRSGSLS